VCGEGRGRECGPDAGHGTQKFGFVARAECASVSVVVSPLPSGSVSGRFGCYYELLPFGFVFVFVFCFFVSFRFFFSFFFFLFGN